jgi:hypothetical protein
MKKIIRPLLMSLTLFFAGHAFATDETNTLPSSESNAVIRKVLNAVKAGPVTGVDEKKRKALEKALSVLLGEVENGVRVDLYKSAKEEESDGITKYTFGGYKAGPAQDDEGGAYDVKATLDKDGKVLLLIENLTAG